METTSDGYKPRTFSVKATPEEPFQFADVLPGPYEVSVSAPGFCWDSPTRQIEVSASDVPGVDFKRTGVSVTFESSHSTEVDAYLVPTAVENDEKKKEEKAEKNEKKLVKSFSLTAGARDECFAVAGVYEFVTRGCHSFGDEPVVFDAAVLFWVSYFIESQT